MKTYIGVAQVSFNIEADNKVDLEEKIRNQLGADLIYEESEIDFVSGCTYDCEDIFHDEKKAERIKER